MEVSIVLVWLVPTILIVMCIVEVSPGSSMYCSVDQNELNWRKIARSNIRIYDGRNEWPSIVVPQSLDTCELILKVASCARPCFQLIVHLSVFSSTIMAPLLKTAANEFEINLFELKYVKLSRTTVGCSHYIINCRAQRAGILLLCLMHLLSLFFTPPSMFHVFASRVIFLAQIWRHSLMMLRFQLCGMRECGWCGM